MQVRGLLIAVVALAVLSGLVYWSNKAEKAKEGQPDPDAAPQITDFEDEQVMRVEVRQAGEETIVLEKNDAGEWRMTAPEELRADSGQVDSLVSTVARLNSNRLVDESVTALADYGLDAPETTVRLSLKDGESVTLLIGTETPTGGNYFAMREGDPRLFTIAGWSRTSINKTPWDLRDKRLLAFDREKLTKIELTAKGQTVELGRNAQGGWQIVSPRPMRADGGAVDQLIGRLAEAQMDAEMEGDALAEARRTFARGARVAVVKVTDDSGVQELEVRKSDDYYASSSAVDGVYKISSTVGEGLDKGLEDLRNKKLFDFGWTEPSKIEVRDGDTEYVFEKSEADWLKNGVKMDAVSVRGFIDELRDLEAIGFPDKGFTEPVFEVRVTAGAGDRAEKVLISKSGEEFFARRENEPQIYQIDSIDFDRLQGALKDVKEAAADEEEDKKEDA